MGTESASPWEEQQRWQGGRSHERRAGTGRGRAPGGTQPRRPDTAPRRSPPAHAVGDHDAGDPRLLARLAAIPDEVRECVAEGVAAAPEGGDADAADGRRPLGHRPRLQPRFSRAPGPGCRTRHPARGDGPGRGSAAVTARHLAAVVDGDAHRGARRRPGGPDGASQPRGDRWRRRRGDVRQLLRPRARAAAARRSAAADSAGPVAQRSDAARVQPAARRDRRKCARRAVRRGPGGRTRDPRPGLVGGQRCRLRHVGCPGDGRGRRTVAGAATQELVVPKRRHRHRVRRPAQGGQGGRWLDQRRVSRGSVWRISALPRGDGRADRHLADGDTGQHAIRKRPRRWKPLRRSQSRRTDRPRRPREADQEHSVPDDPQARRTRHEHGRCDRTGAEPAARTACWREWPDRS